MTEPTSARELFKRRPFDREIIILCVRVLVQISKKVGARIWTPEDKGGHSPAKSAQNPNFAPELSDWTVIWTVIFMATPATA
jgi:hypothetical protein